MLTCDREQEYRGELNIFKMNFIWILLCKCIGGHSQEEHFHHDRVIPIIHGTEKLDQWYIGFDIRYTQLLTVAIYLQ